ncbi:MAG TPA: type III-A CRISPR-associated RAMP protein Csm5 [Candidatus Hydrogenedens sp.]|nr:type III-A CRISPR-associated RAMP protein Csm5 [Candidatus Hydrogenedens sp.]
MINDKKIHGVFKITPITPIHISDGEKYQIFEYYIENKNFYLKDVFKFFQENYQNLDAALKIIEDLSFRLSPEYIRYTLPVFATPQERQKTTSVAQLKSSGDYLKPVSSKHTKLDPSMEKIKKQAQQKQQQSTPQQVRPSAPISQPTEEVFSFIKDPFGQPFIPGSSLKGCLRTAITYYLLKSLNINIPNKILDTIFRNQEQQNQRQKNKNSQRTLLNYIIPLNDVKYDLFKALVIRDSSPFPLIDTESKIKTINNFAICQIQIAKKKNNSIDSQGGIILGECLLPNTTIEIPFYIDTFILERIIGTAEAEAKKKEKPAILDKFRDNKKIFEKLREILSSQDNIKNALLSFSSALIESQKDFFNITDYDSNLKQLKFEQAKNNEILLQLGFGTGYLSKTIALVYPPEKRIEIQKELHLGIGRNYTIDNPFPRSRKLITTKEHIQPSVPLGWFKLEIEKRQP